MDHADGKGSLPSRRTHPGCRSRLPFDGVAGRRRLVCRHRLAGGAIALGFAPAHGFARAVAALILTPAAAAFTVPLIDACLALALGKDRPGLWTRIMATASAAAIVACFATVLNARLWPGIAVLALIATVGYLRGVRRWRPELQLAERPASVPLVLLLLDDDARERYEHPRTTRRPSPRPPRAFRTESGLTWEPVCRRIRQPPQARHGRETAESLAQRRARRPCRRVTGCAGSYTGPSSC